jgi:hypothetical protein
MAMAVLANNMVGDLGLLFEGRVRECVNESGEERGDATARSVRVFIQKTMKTLLRFHASTSSGIVADAKRRSIVELNYER